MSESRDSLTGSLREHSTDQLLQRARLEPEIKLIFHIRPAFGRGLEFPDLLKAVEQRVLTVDADSTRPLQERYACKSPAEEPCPDRHVDPDCAVLALAYPGRDNPGQELRISLNVRDQIEQLHRRVLEVSPNMGCHKIANQLRKPFG